MTDPTHTDKQIPPLDLDEIERRLAARTPEESAARQARLDAWLLGRDAMTIGEQHLAAGDLERAREFFAVATRHGAPDAEVMLNTVTTLLTAIGNPEMISITVGTELDSGPTDTHAERDLTAQHAQDLAHQLEEIRAWLKRTTADAEAKAATIVREAEAKAAAIVDAARHTMSRSDLDTTGDTVHIFTRRRLVTRWRPVVFDARVAPTHGDRDWELLPAGVLFDNGMLRSPDRASARSVFGPERHGDLHPGNVLLTGDPGNGFLIDYGRCRTFDYWTQCSPYAPIRDHDVLAAIELLNRWLEQFGHNRQHGPVSQIQSNLLTHPADTGLSWAAQVQELVR